MMDLWKLDYPPLMHSIHSNLNVESVPPHCLVKLYLLKEACCCSRRPLISFWDVMNREEHLNCDLNHWTKLCPFLNVSILPIRDKYFRLSLNNLNIVLKWRWWMNLRWMAAEVHYVAAVFSIYVAVTKNEFYLIAGSVCL